LLLWNLFWWGLLCLLAARFFQQFLPDRSLSLLLLGLAILMFFNFGVLKSVLSAWIHLPSLHGFEGIEFPVIRPFFPQIPIPLLVLYVGLQIKALQKRSLWLWAAMALTQFVTFAIFPFGMLMMAGTTVVAAVGDFFFNEERTPWHVFLIYALACGISDVLFFLHGHPGRSGAPGQYSLIHVQLSVVPHRMGGMWLILAALTVCVLLLPRLSPQVKWPIVGLAVTNLLLLLGDAFFSETAVQMSTHGGYFVHLTATVLLLFILSSVVADPRLGRITRIAFPVMTALMLLQGIWIAHGLYRAFLPANQEEAAIAQLLQTDPPQANDLIVARALNVDDVCAWAPLVSQSHVLFCRNAQVLLSPEQNQHLQRFRQAIYLYFGDKDIAWVEHVLTDPNRSSDLNRLMFLGEFTTDPADRQKGIDGIRADLMPPLVKAQNGDPEIHSFLSQYRHVIVLDNTAAPAFSAARLAAYLKIETQKNNGKWTRLDCSPL
jgi:hypothetical protein